MNDTPDHLKRNGRSPDSEFTAEEELYRRFSLRQVDPKTGVLIDSSLQFELSTNRQKYSYPKDVLFSPTNEFNGLGILKLCVGDIPQTVTDAVGVVHWFRPAHAPEENNYAHTHIQCEIPIGQQVKGSSSARKKCRSILKQKFTEVLHPEK
jgi:hypothetical protein